MKIGHHSIDAHKENPDYRCFMEHEVTQIVLTPEWIEAVKASPPNCRMPAANAWLRSMDCRLTMLE